MDIEKYCEQHFENYTVEQLYEEMKQWPTDGYFEHNVVQWIIIRIRELENKKNNSEPRKIYSYAITVEGEKNNGTAESNA